MKKRWLALSMFLILFPAIVFSSIATRKRTVRQQFQGDNTGARLESMRQSFAPMRDLLIRKGVPFDPDVLLDEDWRAKLTPVFADMPEMQTIRFEKNGLQAIQMAGTLYLPEHVELQGDTLILAKKVVFEGSDVVIRGNYAFHLFPVETAGVLGTTVDRMMAKRTKQLAALGINAPQDALPPAPELRSHGHITIDTHGDGYKDWVDRMGGPAAVADMWEKLKGGGRSEVLARIDNSGAAGAPGIPGTDGTDPVPLIGSNGTPGAGGVCGTQSTVKGQKGGTGEAGGNAGSAGIGGPGHRGNDGTPINTSVPPGNSDTWTFLSFGGDGGPGGPGGIAKRGGNGGNGGPGGDGADCACTQGGSGNGGDAGDGGRGGKGGDAGAGGQGGDGGNGADINVTFSCDFAGTASGDPHGGNVGAGGSASQPGASGDSGLPSDKPGSGARNSNCTSLPPGGNGGVGGRPIPLGGGFGAKAGDPGVNNGKPGKNFTPPQPCPPPPPPCTPQDCSGGTNPDGYGGGSFGCYWDPIACDCECSPIIVDVEGRGFHLTNVASGVNFDLRGDGIKEHMAWTSPGSGDAFLALDRNHNGTIDNGTELFGNFTEQPNSNHRNGFIALAQFDKPENGGNGDGIISSRDAIYGSLLLWVDDNHNGISEPNELHSLASLGVTAIDLRYSSDRFRDQFGNSFKYRSLVYSSKDDDIGHWAYDIFLLIGK